MLRVASVLISVAFAYEPVNQNHRWRLKLYRNILMNAQYGVRLKLVFVSLATRVSMQVSMQVVNMPWDLEQRCWDNGGHQATSDFLSASHQFMSCTGAREIQSEMSSSVSAGGTWR
ncbi:hypothetical protein GWK47_002422 [Chionoecetes opilio]|uniref:Uncharacterized protein n=1 Tax=Chionoecetes opilio TaxID=41210 RepID=A0A8J5CHL5_CHIOP|nr:hypothetical protein GWK47_002422 [Chionoecetes opilio]